MPFKSEAQRRFLFAKHPDVAREFAAATPKGAKLPEHVKKAYARGRADALAKFGLSTVGEELRLKIPSRSFHGFDAATKDKSKPEPEKKANSPDGHANTIADLLSALPTPRSPLDQVSSRDPLDRTTAWGAPSSLSAGDAASRLSDMGQNSAVGTAI